MRVGLIALGTNGGANIGVVLPSKFFGFPYPHILLATSTCVSAAVNTALLWRGLARAGVYKARPGWGVLITRILFANAVVAALLIWLGGDIGGWLEVSAWQRAVRLTLHRRCQTYSWRYRGRVCTTCCNGRGIIAMELIRGLQGLGKRLRAAITIGSYDGIHLGHGALIASACGIAKQLARPAMMLTFEPLPREYLVPQDPPARLTDFRERWRVLGRSDLHYVCVLRFDEKLRQLSGEQFVELLTGRFGASAVVVGQDFRFGRGGAGSITLLREAPRPDDSSSSWCRRCASKRSA